MTKTICSKALNAVVILSLVLAIGLFGLPETTHGSTPLGGHSLTNVNDVKFTVSWVTGVAETGYIEYGTTKSLGSTAYDDRGTGIVDDTHHCTAKTLTPDTTYYYDIISGEFRDDNGGLHYTVTTGPSPATPPSPDSILGQVLKSDGSTPVGGAIVYVTVIVNAVSSQKLSTLVEASGYWSLDLGSLRTAEYQNFFTYSDTDDVALSVDSGGDGTASETCTVADARNIASPVIMVLSIGTTLNPPSVTTNDADNIGVDSATLHATLDDLGTAASVDVSFEWGETQGGPYPNETIAQSMGATGFFSFDLTSLDPDTTYYFRAKAVGDGTDYGLEKSYTIIYTGGEDGPVTPSVDDTSPPETVVISPPGISTGMADIISSTSAKLNGNLKDLGSAVSVAVSFEWGENEGGPYPNETIPQEMSAIGPFSFDLSGLKTDVTYYYRAKAVGEGTTDGEEKRIVIQSQKPSMDCVVSNLKISPQTVSVGQFVTITVEVTNTGGPGDYDVTLQINGTEVRTESVTLDSSETKTIDFTVARDVAGVYKVELDGQEGTFEVLRRQAWVLWAFVGGGGAIIVITVSIYLFRHRRD